MTSPISTVTPLSVPAWSAPTIADGAGSVGASGFQELFTQSWQDVKSVNATAQQSIESNLIGDDLSMVETFTAVRDADLALRLMLQIRNKLVDAYQELQNLRF